MQTVSFSLDKETVEGINSLAMQAKQSRSDVVRQMYAFYCLRLTVNKMQREATPLLQKLGLETEDDIVAYAKSKA